MAGELTKSVGQIQSRHDLAVFVDALREHLRHHPEEWENRDLPSFLEAMAAWVEDMDGYFKTRGEPVPDQPTWQTLAQILLAAKVYE
ncbi:MAG TPA: hypothetical protein VFA26_17935 [Gemmataceae bacterium]|nr:hypothetical protein [Gemmataceae bacterium]